MSRYEVTASRWEKGWELDIDGVGVTQSRSLRNVDEMVRDYLRLDYGADVAAEADLDVRVVLDGLEAEADRVRREMDDLNARQKELAAESREVAHKLKAAGLTGADTAKMMGVSEQRVSQLTKA